MREFLKAHLPCLYRWFTLNVNGLLIVFWMFIFLYEAADAAVRGMLPQLLFVHFV